MAIDVDSKRFENLPAHETCAQINTSIGDVSQDSRSTRTLIGSAYQELNEGNPNEAIRNLCLAAQKTSTTDELSDDAEVLYWMGRAAKRSNLFGEERLKAARIFYEKAIQTNPKSSAPFVSSLTILAAEEGRFDEVENLFKDLESRDPNSVEWTTPLSPYPMTFTTYSLNKAHAFIEARRHAKDPKALSHYEDEAWKALKNALQQMNQADFSGVDLELEFFNRCFAELLFESNAGSSHAMSLLRVPANPKISPRILYDLQQTADRYPKTDQARDAYLKVLNAAIVYRDELLRDDSTPAYGSLQGVIARLFSRLAGVEKDPLMQKEHFESAIKMARKNYPALTAEGLPDDFPNPKLELASAFNEEAERRVDQSSKKLPPEEQQKLQEEIASFFRRAGQALNEVLEQDSRQPLVWQKLAANAYYRAKWFKRDGELVPSDLRMTFANAAKIAMQAAQELEHLKKKDHIDVKPEILNATQRMYAWAKIEDALEEVGAATKAWVEEPPSTEEEITERLGVYMVAYANLTDPLLQETIRTLNEDATKKDPTRKKPSGDPEELLSARTKQDTSFINQRLNYALLRASSFDLSRRRQLSYEKWQEPPSQERENDAFDQGLPGLYEAQMEEALQYYARAFDSISTMRSEGAGNKPEEISRAQAAIALMLPNGGPAASLLYFATGLLEVPPQNKAYIEDMEKNLGRAILTAYQEGETNFFNTLKTIRGQHTSEWCILVPQLKKFQPAENFLKEHGEGDCQKVLAKGTKTSASKVPAYLKDPYRQNDAPMLQLKNPFD